ncbi:MAG: ABC transporter permease, partial [Oscillospiraceae bacterium]
MMLTGCFAAIVANFYTHSVILSVICAMAASGFVAFIAGIFMVKFKGAMLVVGVSVNVLMAGLTTFFMQIVFGVQGAFVSTKLVSLPKINVDFLKGSPILYTMFASLTWLDLAAFVTAILAYIFLFKTVWGFRLRSVGINIQAAQSLGIKAQRTQIATIAFSGLLSGLGGCLLVMGGVTMFAQNITSGRGFIAMAAANLGAAHPIGTIFSCTFFGFAQSLSNMLQNSAISSELTMAIPYAATIFSLACFNSIKRRGRKKGE